MNTPFKCVLACIALATGCVMADTAAAQNATTPESGVWQKHDYTFGYMEVTTIYSCDGLVDKVKRLLILSGARGDAKVTQVGCTKILGGPDPVASARLVFYTLAPGSGTDGKPVQGVWREVKLAANRRRDLEAGDCELVEQFRDNILKKMFTLRNLHDHTFCIPHQVVGSLIDLQFEVLAPLPGPKAP